MQIVLQSNFKVSHVVRACNLRRANGGTVFCEPKLDKWKDTPMLFANFLTEYHANKSPAYARNLY